MGKQNTGPKHKVKLAVLFFLSENACDDGGLPSTGSHGRWNYKSIQGTTRESNVLIHVRCWITSAYIVGGSALLPSKCMWFCIFGRKVAVAGRWPTDAPAKPSYLLPGQSPEEGGKDEYSCSW